MKTVTYLTGKNNCQRCKRGCQGYFYIRGGGCGFPLIICRKCGRKLRNGLILALSSKYEIHNTAGNDEKEDYDYDFDEQLENDLIDMFGKAAKRK